MAKQLIVGNWKLNGTRAALTESAQIAKGATAGTAIVGICPPFTLLDPMVNQLCALGSSIMVGAQDCHPAGFGA
ncbi:MAG: triose-phosphate isomerase, partial [Pseudomonadota bacterium]